MLGKEPLMLEFSSFGFFGSHDTRPIFNHFHRKIFIDKIKENCEVTLAVNGNLPMFVYLTGIVTGNGN